MGYLCEMHLHSSDVSMCGKVDRKEQIDFYKGLGYNGVFFTDHFWRGNCKIRDLEWQERVRIYKECHESAREYGKSVGVDVFFGFELAEGRSDFLIYGIDTDYLTAHPELENMDIHELLDTFRRDGGLVIQAHPFREARWIKNITLYPANVDGVETVNTHNLTERADKMAEVYAEAYDLIGIAGSDYHADRMHAFCGLVFDNVPSGEREIIDLIRARNFSITEFFSR